MKTCKIQGGLGNQMFQYAIARALETDRMRNVYLDVSFYEENKVSTETYTARKFELDIFKQLRADILSTRQKKMLLSRGVYYRCMRALLGLTPVIVKQKENEFIEMPSVKNIYLDGYFQSEKYFRSIRKDLYKDFQFPEPDERNKLLIEKMSGEKSVSIHVRRGDYVHLASVNNYHGVLPLDYYKQAITLLETTDSGMTYYIFSDDPEYVNNNFDFLPYKVLVDWNQSADSWKDMMLMQACKHHVVANSSFSWWGAWLSREKGVTIAPSKWFSDSEVYNIDDIVPDSWQVISI